MTGTGDEAVGYKRPPKETRFPPGKSGNPGGRPKKPPSFRAELIDELGMPTVFTQNGGQLHVSKQRAIIKAFLAAAADGDLRAVTALLNFCARAQEHDGEDSEGDLSPEDEEILKNFMGRETSRDTSA